MSDIEYIIETALSCQREGRLEEAARIYNQVLEIEPKQPDAIHLLGMVAFANQDYEEAVRLINEAVILNPTVSDYHLNLSSVYLASNQHALAKSHAKVAIKLNPNMGEAHYNLGIILFAEGNINQSIAAFKRSLDLDPNNQTFWTNYLFAVNFSEKATPKDIYKINRKWGVLLEKQIKAKPQFQNHQYSNRRLKLGYYLPELDKHVTVRYLSPILAVHDKVKFELVGYGNRTDNKLPPSEITDVLDRWIDISKFTAAEIAEVMRGDEIDILLHPCTFKSRYRNILAYRAAPIQIACTNLVSTTGLQATDYLITDNFISPVNSDEGLYTEKLIRLSSFNTYKQFTESKDVSSLPAQKNSLVTFGSCNNIAKINSEVIFTWAEILKKVKNSQLLLKHRAFDDDNRRTYITAIFSSAGISRDRLIFKGFTSDRADYLSVYDEIDIALDPFPFGGGTVSYEALWMGVPILTIAGPKFMGRLSGSLMNQLGLSDWVTASKKQYISTGIIMANDFSKLSDLRKNLRVKAQNTIFNAKKYVLELEDALESAWEKYIN
jgi:protein O-GlcNAc transferase